MKRSISAVVLAMAAMILLAGAGHREAAAGRDEQAKARQATAAVAPAPFRMGEALDYRVRWAAFLNAAAVRLSVLGRRPFHGREAWQFQATARTIDPVRLLYTLDDQFDSMSEAASLASIQFQMLIREQGSNELSVVRMDSGGKPVPGDGPVVRVPRGTRDALGMIYYLRTVDWARAPQIRTPVYDGKKLYEARARLETAAGSVTVPAGAYTASRIEVRIFEQEKEVQQTRFWVWLANDNARTPVLIEAELPFGSLRVELRAARH